MSWMPNVDFNDVEIADLYVFLRTHHGLDTGTENSDAQAGVPPDESAAAASRRWQSRR
jgi:hypothetical protein